jgi:hypothetical protein
LVTNEVKQKSVSVDIPVVRGLRWRKRSTPLAEEILWSFVATLPNYET